MLKEMHIEDTYIAQIDRDNFALAKEHREYLNISKNEEYTLRNWFKLDGSFYLLKYVDSLNEFIGECLAKKIQLRTAHYIPVLKDDNILVASRNFKRYNCSYLNVEEMNKVLPVKEILDDPKYALIRENLFKLFSLDIYMRQMDRSIPNILFEITTDDNIFLAPTFDYSNSFFINEYKRYDNPIMDIPMDKYGFDRVMNNYPDLYQRILEIENIELEEILNEICEKFDFELLSDVKSYYLKEEEKSKKILKKVLM